MTLYHLHRTVSSLAILFCFAFALWALRGFLREGGTETLVLAVLATVFWAVAAASMAVLHIQARIVGPRPEPRIGEPTNGRGGA